MIHHLSRPDDVEAALQPADPTPPAVDPFAAFPPELQPAFGDFTPMAETADARDDRHAAAIAAAELAEEETEELDASDLLARLDETIAAGVGTVEPLVGALEPPAPDIASALEAKRSDAAWLARAHQALARKLDRIERQREVELARVQAFWDARTGPLEKQLQELHEKLLLMAPTVIAGKKKSYDTPYGTLGVRTNPERWSVDAEAFLAYAKATVPDLVKVETKTIESVERAQAITHAKAVLQDTGELVPGVERKPAVQVPYFNGET